MVVTPISNLILDTGADTAASLGDVRVTPVPAKFDMDVLRRALMVANVLPNPNKSPGCSPVIRAFLLQTGLPFGVSRELANDGDTTGHQSGNALDVVATTGSRSPDAALADLCAVLRAVSFMFTRFSHVDVDYPNDGLRMNTTTALDNSTHHSIHVESTRPAMLYALTTWGSYITSALATWNTVTPFGNRRVHFNSDIVAHNASGNSAPGGPGAVQFW